MPSSSDLTSAFAIARQRVGLLQHQPQAFPPPAGPVDRVECIETHISWVLLAGDFAYKFKKPLQLEFLDFSTQALRHAACEEELRINRRTAPGLYLGLVGLVVVAADDAPPTLRLVPWQDAPPGAEPAVWMRRFSQDALLATALDQQRVSPAQTDLLARHVAQFHAAAAVATGAEGWGTAAAVRAPVDDCLAALRTPVAGALPGQGPMLARVAGWCEQQAQALAPVFEARRVAGRVRECHGDLHLANIALIDGQPQLFDALEFNPALRWIDCMADIAFVVMDLAAHGRADLAWRFLNRWLEHTGDYAGLVVLRYYGSYRALVRARVATLQLGPSGGGVQAAQAVQGYLELAADFAGQRPARWPVARSAGLWLAHGFSGAGKSTHALALACQRGWVRVRADVERKRLFGLAPEAASDGIPGGIYTAEATLRTHQRLAQVAREALAAGYSVIVDATLLDRDARALLLALAGSAQVPCRILSFEAPLPVLRERVRQRALAGGGASEADVAVLDAQWVRAHPLQPHEEAITLHVDTTAPVDWDRQLPP